MRHRIRLLATLAAFPLLFGGCILDDWDQTANLFKVSFHSADPAFTGPTISGPSPVELALKLALPTYAGGITKEQALGQYSLVVTFHVVGDNRGNSGRASFAKDLQPQLNFYINSKSNAPLTATIDSFSIDSGEVKTLDFPVSIPLTSIDQTILKQIVNGDDIPYYLTGSLNFHLMQGLTLKGDGFAEVDLATGAIPTRPSGSWSLAGILMFLPLP